MLSHDHAQGKFSTQNFNYLPLCLPSIYFAASHSFAFMTDHFSILLPSSIQQSNRFCSELPEREMCSLIYLSVTWSSPFLWGFTSLSPTDPCQWLSEVTPIKGTTLGVCARPKKALQSISFTHMDVCETTSF